MNKIKLNTVPSGTILYDGRKWDDVMYISDGYYIKTLNFSSGDSMVKAIRLFYDRVGRVIGELTTGYSAKNAAELLNKYEWLK